MTALHLKLVHPTAHQLRAVTKCYFYATDLDRVINHVTASCHICASVKKLPHTLVEQASSDPPEAVGCSFAADVMRRERQYVLVVRETVTSYTATCFLENEQAQTLRNALVQLCLPLCPLDGPLAIVRTDPVPGFCSLAEDSVLLSHRIRIETGQPKNVNKNPVAERAVQELQEEFVRQDPRRGPTSALALAIATARLNTKVRSSGLSSCEMLFQRDQFTSSQLPLEDHSGSTYMT